MKHTTLCLYILLLIPAVVVAQDAQLDKQRCAKPNEFALIFSFGYAADHMPKEDARFDDLLGKLKAAHFNVVHCSYTDKRLELCKKHGIKMMVDLLVDEHHVYKNVEKAQALCEKLRKNPDVWGYNIWNDPFGKTVEGRKRDINNVRRWDPTHPAFAGTYRVVGMSRLTNPDVFGYYDFHWKRGTGQHFPHLLAYSNWAKERDAWFYTWLSATSGLPGKGNFNRSLFSANTGIACGLKGFFWFLGDDLMNKKTLEWTEHGRDIIKVQTEIAPLRKEIVKLSMPSAIYSTPITKTLNNDPVPDTKKDAYPPGLDGRAIPKDFWLQPMTGEFMFGVCTDEQKRNCVYLANNNAYVEQKVAIKLGRNDGVEIFARKAGSWKAADVQDGVLRLDLAPGGGELLRFGK
jgi:hypothetical protein